MASHFGGRRLNSPDDVAPDGRKGLYCLAASVAPGTGGKLFPRPAVRDGRIRVPATPEWGRARPPGRRLSGRHGAVPRSARTQAVEPPPPCRAPHPAAPPHPPLPLPRPSPAAAQCTPPPLGAASLPAHHSHAGADYVGARGGAQRERAFAKAAGEEQARGGGGGAGGRARTGRAALRARPPHGGAHARAGQPRAGSEGRAATRRRRYKSGGRWAPPPAAHPRNVRHFSLPLSSFRALGPRNLLGPGTSASAFTSSFTAGLRLYRHTSVNPTNVGYRKTNARTSTTGKRK